jgi:hypothetical protein
LKKPKLSQLNDLVLRDNLFIDKQTQLFVKNMESVLRDVEKRLVGELQRYMAKNQLNKVGYEFGMVARENISKILKDSGYYKAVEGVMSSYAQVPKMISQQYKLFDYKLNFNPVEKNYIKGLFDIAGKDYFNLGEKTASNITKAIYSASIGERSFTDYVDIISDSIESADLKKYAYTFANTSMQMFYRDVSHVSAEKTGWDNYIYAGPEDGKTRQFCESLLRDDKTYSREEIDAMDNGQLPDVFATGGGYNCRHNWYAVPPDFK